ncbi:MAG: FlgD immunoglobulin-like domain containing protein [bacterium]
MRKLILFIFIAVYLFIQGSVFSSLSDKPDPKFSPDSATNYSLYEFTNIYPINSNILMYGYARMGGSGTDTTYNGTVYIDINEENPDNSCYAHLSGIPRNYFTMSNGELFFYITNTEKEVVSVTIRDSLGNLKPSFGKIIEFKGKASAPTGISIKDDTLFAVESYTTYFIRYTDDNDSIFFDYAPVMTDSTLKITVLDNSDSTVMISSLDESGYDTIYPMIINGGYFVQLGSSAVRDVDLLVEPLLGTHSLQPETLHMECLPESESPTVMALSFSGFNQTRGKDKNILLLNMAEDGPISTNNTSIITPTLYDLSNYGASLTNTGSITLESGVGQLYIQADSVNPAIALKIEDSGIPDLYKFNTYSFIQFKDIGEAVKGELLPQQAGVAGDTAGGLVFVCDAYGNADNSFKGFARIEPQNASLDIINADSGVYDEIAYILWGMGEFRMYYPNAGTTYTKMSDYESDMLYSYFSTNMFDGIEKRTVWFEGTTSPASRLQLFLPENKSIAVRENEIITIAAMSNDSISTIYNDYVSISVSGSAESNRDSIMFENGIGSFFIRDTVPENVVITVSDGAMSDIDTLHVYDDSKASLIAVAGKTEMLVNGDNDMTFFAMTSTFENDSSYNGTIHLIIDDTHGDSMSFTCPGGTGSIAVSGGMVTKIFTNSEAERINMSGYAVSGTDTIPVEELSVLSQYQIYPHPDTLFNPDGDTLFMEIVDADSVTVNYSTQLDQLYAEEENPNSSFTIHSSYNPFSIANGTAELIVSDTEPEIVELYTEYYDTLLADYDTYKLLYTLDPASGIIPATGGSIDDYYISNPYPSPSPGDVSIKFGTPVKSDVRVNVYDQSGRLINSLMDRNLSRGHYMVKWRGYDSNGSEVPSGTYFVIIRFGDSALRDKKIIRIK